MTAFAKAKVEVAVQVAERWILARLRNETFFTLAALNTRIAARLTDLNDRPMKGYGGASRRARFERFDRPALQPLPRDRYVHAAWRHARVNIDSHVEVDRHDYSVPHALVHTAVEIRLGDPDRKGKVEAGVGHAQKTPLKGLRFETIDAAQAYLDRWEARWADTRIHGTTKRQVAVMFAEERPALGPLPLEPFRYYRFGDRTVHLNGCVEVESAYYGAPPGWLGQRVPVQWNDLHVRLLAPKTGQLLREHLRTRRGWYQIHADDRPARTPRSTVALLARATTAGPHISAICTHIHHHDGIPGVRRILGVLALAKKHGPAVVEDAAKAALEIGVPTYRFLRKYIERRPPVPLTIRQVDPLIRQLTLYRDLIDTKTGDPT